MNFSQSLIDLKNNHLYRKAKIIDNSMIDFCSNNYLGLKNHPKVIKAFKKGADKYGIGSGASHLVSGHSLAHEELERALAAYTGQQKALLFSTGYMANMGVFSALRDKLDWVLQDKLNHASLIDANFLTNLPIQRFLHNDIDSLTKKAQKQHGQGLIVVDNIFSMDGDKADVVKIANIAQKSNAIFMQDDAHGFGVFKPNIPQDSIYMATLGKALGTMGAFVAGNKDLIDFLVQKSRPYIYTTAISPALCSATLKSLDIVKKGKRQEMLFKNIVFFKKTAEELNLKFMLSSSAIQPMIIGSNKKTLIVADKLAKSGFYVSAIRPPTVAKNTARLRITLSSNHTFSQIKQLLKTLKNAL